jgi:hypothetical protein
VHDVPENADEGRLAHRRFFLHAAKVWPAGWCLHWPMKDFWREIVRLFSRSFSAWLQFSIILDRHWARRVCCLCKCWWTEFGSTFPPLFFFPLWMTECYSWTDEQMNGQRESHMPFTSHLNNFNDFGTSLIWLLYSVYPGFLVTHEFCAAGSMAESISFLDFQFDGQNLSNQKDWLCTTMSSSTQKTSFTNDMVYRTNQNSHPNTPWFLQSHDIFIELRKNSASIEIDQVAN